MTQKEFMLRRQALIGILQDMDATNAAAIILNAIDYVAPKLGYRPADFMRVCIDLQELVEKELGLPEDFPRIKVSIKETKLD